MLDFLQNNRPTERSITLVYFNNLLINIQISIMIFLVNYRESNTITQYKHVTHGLREIHFLSVGGKGGIIPPDLGGTSGGIADASYKGEDGGREGEEEQPTPLVHSPEVHLKLLMNQLGSLVGTVMYPVAECT